MPPHDQSGVPDLPPPALEEVHLWVVSPAAAAAETEALLVDLSPHERMRAQGMDRHLEREAFVVGRARVRQILSRYVGLRPHELDLVSRVDGKPAFAGAPAWFDFSFSRCAAVHVCAVAASRRIGVDVETIDGGPDPTLWTKRQAVAKAAGLDRRTATAQLVVPSGMHGEVHFDAHGTGTWNVSSFVPGPGLVGAVAAAGTWRMILRHYPADVAFAR